jgi:diguanylate cyclase (GGDEF)-like protein/PAS domain S-box-containing protein
VPRKKPSVPRYIAYKGPPGVSKDTRSRITERHNDTARWRGPQELSVKSIRFYSLDTTTSRRAGLKIAGVMIHFGRISSTYEYGIRNGRVGESAMEVDPHFYEVMLEGLYEGVYFMDKDRRILYWSKGAERITGFGANEVIGSHCRDNVLIHVNDQGSRLCGSDLCPALKTMNDGRKREAEVYLHHKNGHRLPVLTRILAVRRADGDVIGAIEIFTDNRQALETKNRIVELEKQALIDPLTQIGNRRYAEIQLQRCLGEMHRYGWPFAVFFMDIDHFKRVNDAHGHDTGDRVLQTVAKTMVKSIRSTDTLARWGGEEFVAIVPNCEASVIELMGNKLRTLVEQSYVWKESGAVTVTLSVGATTARSGDSLDTMMRRADRLMYQSKLKGRNQVTTDVTVGSE